MSVPLLNPYADLVRELQAQVSDTEALLRIRKKLIWSYSWAIPSAEAIQAIAELGPVVELGAGTGYWAWLIRQAGGEIQAWDRNIQAPPRWYAVREGGPEVLAQSSASALLLCWPPLAEPLASRSLDAFQGEWLVYVGEPHDTPGGARTADAAFFEALAARFALQRTIEIPCWPGFRDQLFIYRRLPGLRPGG